MELVVVVVGLVAALALAPVLLAHLVDRQPWPRKVTFLVAGYFAQLGTTGGANFTVARGTVRNVSATIDGVRVVVDSVTWGSEVCVLRDPPRPEDGPWLRHWSAEAIPVMVLHHFDGHVELHGPEGVVFVDRLVLAAS